MNVNIGDVAPDCAQTHAELCVSAVCICMYIVMRIKLVSYNGIIIIDRSFQPEAIHFFILQSV